LSRSPDAARRLLLALLVGAGAALRLLNFLARPSLTLDEAAVALTVVGRPVSTYLSPLAGGQIAPWGFLVVERGLFHLFGRSDQGLRLLPLAASIASCVLAWRLAERMLTGVAVPFAVGAFALSPGLIYTAGQLKQYATEIAATLLITLLAAGALAAGLTLRRAVRLGAAGLALALLSQSVVITLAALFAAAALLAIGRRDRSAALPLAVVCAFWGAGGAFALVSNLRLMTAEGRAYVRSYWALGFMPWPPEGLEPLRWAWGHTEHLFGPGFLFFPAAPAFAVLCVAGAVVLARKRPEAALMLGLPVALVLAASAFRVYPFAPGRLTAFLVPALLFFVAASVEAIRRLLDRWSRPAGWAFVALVSAAPFAALAAQPPPYAPEPVRPALERLRERRRPGDTVYVFYGAAPAFRFYAPLFGFADLPPGEIVFGSCGRDEPRRVLAELDALRGRPRVWVLVTHGLPAFRERDVLIGYLRTIGVERESLTLDPAGGIPGAGLTLALFDLSDPSRLASASAATAPLPDLPRGSEIGLPCAGPVAGETGAPRGE